MLVEVVGSGGGGRGWGGRWCCKGEGSDTYSSTYSSRCRSKVSKKGSAILAAIGASCVVVLTVVGVEVKLVKRAL